MLPAWVSGVLQNGLPSALDNAVTGVLTKQGALPLTAAAATDPTPQTAPTSTSGTPGTGAAQVAGPAPESMPSWAPWALAGLALLVAVAVYRSK